MNPLRLFAGEVEIEFDLLFFPGGEPHIALPTAQASVSQVLTIDARLCNCNAVVALLVLVDAVRRSYRPERLGLVCQYFPGARQDRVEAGGALTAKVFAELINSQAFDRVVVLDAHSPVSPALLDRCVSVPLSWVVQQFRSQFIGYDGIVCPDSGAAKRAHQVADALGLVSVVHGRKKRDPATGKLSGFDIETFPRPGRYLLVDDICDGGGTFIGLAQVIPEDVRLDLLVAHGIFSKGFGALVGRFERIITTDSVAPTEGFTERSVIVLETSRFIRRMLWN